MIVKEMEKNQAFDCKCGGSRKENTEGCSIKHLSGLHLQTKGNHGIRDREGEASISMYMVLSALLQTGCMLWNGFFRTGFPSVIQASEKRLRCC
ncbi:hypothetical protein J4Q44_G00022500 [Coregonus suidteri]|uniref:Uncharacterized protein n=1 Tax=Coregonus suidteri TaxID=861788 RepID=A0AAN8MLX2_9TELE